LSISTKLTKANITAVLNLLETTPRQLETLSAPLSTEELQTPLGSGQRSLTEDLAHLINCEARSAEAIYLALLLDQPLFPNIHPERQWGKLFRTETFPFSDLLAYFKFRRNLLLNVLHPLTDAQWERTIREEGKKRQESVYWRARTIALHEREHLIDLEGKLGRGQETIAN
jgi:hypothetical protein